MSYILDILACGGVVIGELLLIFIGTALLQLIIYQTTGISLIKVLIRASRKFDIYLSNKF